MTIHNNTGLPQPRFGQIAPIPDSPDGFPIYRAWDTWINRPLLMVAPSHQIWSDPSLCEAFLERVRQIAREGGPRKVYDLVFEVYLIMEDIDLPDPQPAKVAKGLARTGVPGSSAQTETASIELSQNV